MHSVPATGKSKYPDDVPCIDQEDEDIPCPGCEGNLKRSFKGFINVIWYDGPVYKRDADNKIVKDSDGDKQVIDERDQVALWKSGTRVFDVLEELDTKLRGKLSSRTFEVKRKGKKLDTHYSITPWDMNGGEEPFTSAEKKLLKDKHDIALFTKPPTYEEFQAKIEGRSPEKDSDDNPFPKKKGGPAKPGNPFAAGKPRKKPSPSKKPVRKPSRPSR